MPKVAIGSIDLVNAGSYINHGSSNVVNVNGAFWGNILDRAKNLMDRVAQREVTYITSRSRVGVLTESALLLRWRVSDMI